MTGRKLTARQEAALRRLEEKYTEALSEISALGFVLQGSVTERWMECGNHSCWCHEEGAARHGPYYQWSWKSHGRTHSVYLSKEQAIQCKRWLKNNRRLEKIIKRLRQISLRVARLRKIAPK